MDLTPLPPLPSSPRVGEHRHSPRDAVSPSPSQSAAPGVQAHYLALRSLVGTLPLRPLSLSLEAVAYGILGPWSWRPTHISHAATVAVVEDWPRRGSRVQRAHGTLPGRVDRWERDRDILTDPEEPLPVWWDRFVAADSTVLLARSEHVPGLSLSPAHLIPLPPPAEGLFLTSGFGVRLRRRGEGDWLRARYTEITGRGAP